MKIIRKNKLLHNFLEILVKLIDLLFKQFNLRMLEILKKILLSLNAEVIFVIEDENWAANTYGKYITESLNKQKLIKTEVGYPLFAKYNIIHFASISCLIPPEGYISFKKSNKIVVSWFHIAPDDKRLMLVPLLNKEIDVIHTSCGFTKQKLIELGFKEDKIVKIPLGVDLSVFKEFEKNKRIFFKKKYNLPNDKIIIGSFQKDGVGWEEGLEPKLVKGPDIFCEVVKKIHENFDIHVFLTGPARGYVKKRLDEYHIPYTHIFLENYLDIVECYNALDLYLLTSRAEGGPRALLEGMATGVPIVTTNVGMAPDLIKQGVNGYITEIEDMEQLSKYSTDIIKNRDLRLKIIKNGLKTVQEYTWENVAKQYYQKIYRKILLN